MKTRDGKCGEKEEGWKVHTVFQNPSSDGRGRRCISVSLKSATLLFSTAAVLWALTCSRHSAAGLKHFFVCVARSANTNEPDWSCGRLKKQNTHVPVPPPAHLFLGKQKKTSMKTKSSDDNKLVEKLTSDWTIPGWLWVVSQNNWAVLF